MGASYTEIKVLFKDSKHSSFINHMFKSLNENQFPIFEEENDYLTRIFTNENYIKVKANLISDWCFKGDSLSLEEITLKNELIELKIMGGPELENTEMIIRAICMNLDAIIYEELNSYSNVDGLNFIWRDNEKLLSYYDDQSENYEELNLDNGFKYCFNFVQNKIDVKLINIVNKEISDPNYLLFLLDSISLEEIQMRLKQHNLELLRKNEKSDISSSPKRSTINDSNNKGKVGLGMASLFKNKKK